MIRRTKFFAVLVGISAGLAFSQTSCPHFLISSSMVVNIEGRFTNSKFTRSSLDIEWRHHNDTQDTFFVNLPDSHQFTYVTAGDHRYMEYAHPKVKRQLGTHHLKENIGETPLKLDDLELLANGQFLCRDTLEQSRNIFSTAFSMAWWSLAADTLPYPKNVIMRGSKKESRIFTIGQWKSYAGEMLPTSINLTSAKYDGTLWVRSAYPIQALESDPLRRVKKKHENPPVPKLFGKIAVEGEREIPLIFKLNQELLRE